MTTEHKVSYTSTNTYHTLNKISPNTKNIWIVFHGMGYLGKYFSKYFLSLHKDENYIIIPQAPSKYYQGKKFKHVGASWLTRENTKDEIENVLRYIDAVYQEQVSDFPKEASIIIMGYSQGVSIATRWVASRQIVCNQLILHSGGIPNELTQSHFTFLPTTSKVHYIYGLQDEYINEARITEQTLLGTNLFNDKLNIHTFNGPHEVHVPFIEKIEKGIL